MRKGFFSSISTSKQKYISTIPTCGSCGLYKNCQSPKMEVTGHGRKKVLVVAECPGKNEDARGMQLIGDSGQLLRKALKKFNIQLERDCWKTNAVTCFPDRNPTDKEIEYCRPNLIKAIKRLKPNVIILLGGSAVKSLIGHLWKKNPGAITQWVGWQIPCQQLNAWICPTYHPSYLLRSNEPVLDLWFSKHLEAAFGLEGKPWPDGPPDYSSQIECILNPRKAASFIKKILTEGGPIAFDFETDRLKPDAAESRVVCCAVSLGERRTIAFPWAGDVIQATQALLDGFEQKYGWNIKFEDRWWRKLFNHGVSNWLFDGMEATHVLDNRRGITSLKFQSFVQLGQPQYDAHISPYLEANGGNEKNRIKEIELGELLKYCGMDALTTYLIIEKQRRQMGF